VLGRIGSGKSTILRLMAGLYQPTDGFVEVDGIDLRQIEPADFRARVGFVAQDPRLFQGTLRENVDFGSDEPGDELFEEAVAAAQMQAEIAEFPAGQATVVGQRGVSLSGGQKQRMAIARAVARKPELMLFDDITASLDAANEERLMRALERRSGDLSFVIVSHRLSTLQYVDKVLYLEGGKALAYGTHEELLSNERYRAFIEEHPGKVG